MNEKNAHRLLAHLRSESRVWYRAIQTRFIATALHTTHTTSRFNPGGSFRLLYLAESHLVALLEVQVLQDIEAFCTLSAKAPDQMNLVIFPDRLLPGSYIEFYNPVSGDTERLVRTPGVGQAEIIVV